MAPNDKPSSIPAWQHATSIPGAEDVTAEPAPEPTKADAKEPAHEPARSEGPEGPEGSEGSRSKDDIDDLRDHASKFLSDASIKDAPRERKVAFLESKGLKQGEIELLLSSQPAQVQAAVCMPYCCKARGKLTIPSPSNPHQHKHLATSPPSSRTQNSSSKLRSRHR